MKKKYKILLILICIVVIFLILFSWMFPLYLESEAMENDYASAKSEDGKWTAYLIPDPRGMMNGYLIYQEKKEDINDVVVSIIDDGEYYGTEIEEKSDEIDEDFSTKAQKYILSGKNYYQFWEFGDSKEDMDLTISWKEGNKTYQTNCTVKYDKWNWYDIYCSIDNLFIDRF